MKILSLFDGISALRLALQNAGFQVDEYYASEVCPRAIQVSQSNFPDIVQIGDVKNVDGSKYKNFDLLCGGSPCQDFSILNNKRQGTKGKKSSMVWEYVRILRESRPKFFLLENVFSMSKKERHKISNALGVSPIRINSSLVTAQSRNRLYWTNIKGIQQPENRNIFFQDIIESGFVDKEKSPCCTSSYKGIVMKKYVDGYFVKPIVLELTTIGIAKAKNPQSKLIMLAKENEKITGTLENGVELNYQDDFVTRLATPLEFERLQGFPDYYTNVGISNTARYKAIGNSFTIPVIEHILSYIENGRVEVEQMEMSWIK